MTNSPGEIKGWVTPVVKEIVERRTSDVERDRIIIFIPYCQYASGTETEIAKNIPGVDHVFSPGEYLKFLFLNKGVKGGFAKKGVLVHLGSDYMHSVLISGRLGYPAVAYTHDAGRFYNAFFRKFIVTDENSKKRLSEKGIDAGKIEIAGDLFVEAVKPGLSREESRSRCGAAKNEILVGIFPGSRPYQIKHMTSFFLKCCSLIRGKFPESRFVLSRASFVTDSQLSEAVKAGGQNGALEGIKAEFADGLITTEDGTRVIRAQEMPYDVMNACDLILTIPGTNTAQIAAAGCPMIVVVPLNKPEEIPLDGIAGYVQYIPLIGRILKKKLVLDFGMRLKYTAIPNQKAGQEVVPEIKDFVDPGMVLEKASELIRNSELRAGMSARLKEVMGEGGAAARLAGIILKTAEGV